MPNGGGRTVAVFGGSFDPPTRYHYQICWFLLKLGVNELRTVPTSQQPIKGEHTASFEHRAAMLRRMTDHLSTFFGTTPIVVDQIESQRSGPSYTIDTLRDFRAKEPNTNFIVVMGSDSILSLDHWKEPEAIVSGFHMLSIPRDPEEPSSSLLREKMADGEWDFVGKHLHETTMQYIRQHGLYSPRK